MDAVDRRQVGGRGVNRLAQAAVRHVAGAVVEVVRRVDHECLSRAGHTESRRELGAVASRVGRRGDQARPDRHAEGDGVAEVDGLGAEGEVGGGELSPATKVLPSKLATESRLEELDRQRIGGVRRGAIDEVGHDQVAAGDRHALELRKVLQPVGAGVGVQRVVGGETVPLEVDSPAAVREHGVAPDGMLQAAAVDRDAHAVVAGDDVAFARRGTADQDSRAAVEDDTLVVGQRRNAVRGDADEVALNRPAGGERPQYAEAATAGDDISFAWQSAAESHAR